MSEISPPVPPTSRVRLLIQSYWMVHGILALLCLLMTLPMLWSGILPHSVVEALGYILSTAMALSLLWLVISLLIAALRLRNLELLGRLFSFLALWAFALGIFSLIAYAAKVEKTTDQHPLSSFTSTPLFLPEERLIGRSSLQLYYDSTTSPSVNDRLISKAPSLSLLSTKHPQLFRSYIEQSLRWKHEMSDQFYAELGHVVLTEVSDPTGAKGSVHASFRRLIEGESIPHGYHPAKPDELFPYLEKDESESTQNIPDIALDLGGDYVLLLAWRGRAEDSQHAYQALNAAITAIDEQFNILAKKPTDEGLQSALRSSKSHRGTQPEIRLNSPPSQYGCYQAEVYANPAQNGYFSLIAKDIETGKELSTISFRSMYSYDDQELFRHEIPQSLPAWMRKEEWTPQSGNSQVQLPLFTFEQSEHLRSFHIDLELWFSPYGSQREPRLLTRKRYRVQSFQTPSLKTEHAPARATASPPSITP